VISKLGKGIFLKLNNPRIKKIASEIPFIVIFLIIVEGPLLAVLFGLTGSIISSSISLLAIPEMFIRRFGLLTNSLALAVAVSILTSIIGLLVAIFIWLSKWKYIKYTRYLLFLFLLVPPFLHAQAWIFFTDMLNTFLSSFTTFSIDFNGLWASAWVSSMTLLPITAGLALIGFDSVEKEQIEASRLFSTDSQTFFKIILPNVLNYIFAGATLVFILSLTDYSLPSVFRFNVYALEIFADYSASGLPQNAFLLSLPILTVTLLVALTYLSWFRDKALQLSFSDNNKRTNLILPKWLHVLGALGIIVLLLMIFIPITNLTWEALKAKDVSSIFFGSTSEIIYSIIIASIAAVICQPIAYIVANKINVLNFRGRFWWLLTSVPLAIPASLTGIGLIFLWNRPYLPDMYGSYFMPVLALVTRFTPVATIILYSAIKGRNSYLEDVTRLHYPGFLRVWIRIRIPMLLPTLLSSSLLVFAFSFGELGATLLVVPPGNSTLTIKIYNYLHYGSTSTVAVLCLCMLLLTFIPGIIAIISFAVFKRRV